MSARRLGSGAAALLAVLACALASAAQPAVERTTETGPPATLDDDAERTPETRGLPTPDGVDGAADETPFDAGPTRGFVAVDGTHFVVDGAPFRFVGANVAVMHGPAHRAAMEATLDAAASDGLTVVRLWALGEYAADAPAWADAYGFRRGPDTWLEPSLVHLDRALEACRARGLRAIVVLGNRWPDYGGVGAYLRWAGVPFAPDGAGAVPTSELARFFESSVARDLYRAHVARIVSRTNSVSGVAYRDDPTLLAWELMNELEASRRDASSLVRWVEAEAAFVRSLDARHLVSAGHVGYSGASERRTWREVAGARGIDFADAHAYPTRFGEVTSTTDLARWIDDRAQLAHHVLERPLVFGEVGFSATRPRVHGVARRRWLDAFLRAAARDGVAGALAWIYAPGEDSPSEHAILTTGPGIARTRDLRGVLARHARRWARSPPEERNARLGAAVGEELLWDPRRTVLGGGGVHGEWSHGAEDGTRVLEIAVAAFDRARFERAGLETDAPIAHLWASGAGWVRYRFRRPRGSSGPPGALTFSLRASSELPGPGVGARADDVSHLRVSLDGIEVGVLELPPDDGLGAVLSLTVTDAAALDALAERGTHTLELAVGEDDLGACLYGEPGARSAELPDALRAELPGRIRLAWRG